MRQPSDAAPNRREMCALACFGKLEKCFGLMIVANLRTGQECCMWVWMGVPYLENIRDHTTSVSQSVLLPNPVADELLIFRVVECCPQVSGGEHLALTCKPMPFVKYGMQQNPGDLSSMGCSKRQRNANNPL